MNSPKKSWYKRINKRFSILFISLLCFTCVTLVLVNSYLERKETSEIAKEPTLDETPKALIEEVFPDEKTEFFSKEDGKSLLWYTLVNDSVVFYKTKGKHPITGQDLQPVTKEIIQKYINRLEPEKKTASVEPKRNYKVGEVKILKKKKQPVVKKKIVRESIWNTSLINSKERDEVSLFVFNVKDQIDMALTNHIKKEFEKKNYFITKEVIHYDMMSSAIAVNLQNKNVNYFNGNLEKYTDYICCAKASYTYRQNEFRDDFLDCTMTIEYFIYSSATGEVLVSEKDKVIGSDQNKQTAKLRAIEKFVL